MTSTRPNNISMDNSIAREKARQKRQREGGNHTMLGDRLDHHKKMKMDGVTSVEVISEKVYNNNNPVPVECPPVLPQFQQMVNNLLEGIPEPAKCCPFHGSILECKQSESGWAYYRCPVENCIFLCGLDQVDDWLKHLPRKLHPSYKEDPDSSLNIKLPFVCFCTHEAFYNLRLKKSTSDKNPGRFFMGCKHKQKDSIAGCHFFQWLNLPLMSRNARAWKKQA